MNDQMGSEKPSEYTLPSLAEKIERDTGFLADASSRVVENTFDLLRHAMELGDIEEMKRALSRLNKMAEAHIWLLATIRPGAEK